ncbi:MAG TPA: coenzyme F420-0:L-glutamate ligase [Alphaproteobacteria bacterium]|jgi:coenzyme F420-0:L-glutamate ligase/coenzyme F420-1:gamma-L-glutamate ligase|nr:coenzyme F420-0:L-glutamate ligase [Alphaproteobacteria bacterium]HAM48766.1 coenzyme F420-0:L-glutamate ligase [Alphaproteobacteria bacterium]HBA44099.1 coenzyme F420-0:L-glutamate ligase [Alphaproteobacteria bacterium]HBC53828.1 coenzyme F420-0:L-glutamate ligase [Alphaproteobacteria bacterium]HBF97579.1 coenzyme F420-0:L-glutamate ligase [Alphaproteobacteria bacterium]
MTAALSLTGLPGIPLIAPGDDLAAILGAGMDAAGLSFAPGDVLVLAQKIVSKAEGRYADLAAVVPSPRAVALATEVDKDPRLVELILSESTEVVRHRPGVLIVAHRIGVVMANAGIDHSNIPHPEGTEQVLLLPEDPDASAERMRREIAARFGAEIAVVICDSVGRAWRNGTVGIAIGVAGLASLIDLRGERDLFGRVLEVSEVGTADAIASAAGLLMGEGAEGVPAVLMRGFVPPRPGPARDAAALVRDKRIDMFR